MRCIDVAVRPAGRRSVIVIGDVLPSAGASPRLLTAANTTSSLSPGFRMLGAELDARRHHGAWTAAAAAPGQNPSR